MNYSASNISFITDPTLDSSIIYYFSDDQILPLSGYSAKGVLQVYNEDTQEIETFNLTCKPRYRDNAIKFSLSDIVRNYGTIDYKADMSDITDSRQIISFKFTASVYDQNDNVILSLWSEEPHWTIDSTLDKYDNVEDYNVNENNKTYLMQSENSKFLTTFKGEHYVTPETPATLTALNGYFGGTHSGLTSPIHCIVYNLYRSNLQMVEKTVYDSITDQTVAYYYDSNTQWVNNLPIGGTVTSSHASVVNQNGVLYIGSLMYTGNFEGLCFENSLIPDNAPLGYDVSVDVKYQAGYQAFSFRAYNNENPSVYNEHKLNNATNNIFSVPGYYDSFKITTDSGGAYIQINSITITAKTGNILTPITSQVSAITYTTTYPPAFEPDKSLMIYEQEFVMIDHYEYAANYPMFNGMSIMKINGAEPTTAVGWIEHVNGAMKVSMNHTGNKTLTIKTNGYYIKQNKYHRLQFDIIDHSTSSLNNNYADIELIVFAGHNYTVNNFINAKANIKGHYDLVIYNDFPGDTDLYMYFKMSAQGFTTDAWVTIDNIYIQDTTGTTNSTTITPLAETVITSAITYTTGTTYSSTPFNGFTKKVPRTVLEQEDAFQQLIIYNDYNPISALDFPIPSTDIMTASGRMLYIPAGPLNLTNYFSGVSFQNVDYYDVFARNGTNTQISEKVRFTVKKGRGDLTEIPIIYKNRLGTFDTVVFYRGYEKTLQAEKNIINNKLNTYRNNAYGFLSKTPKQVVLSVNKTAKIKVFSDYLSEDISLSIADLFYSDEIYLWMNDQQIPVLVYDKEMVQLIKENRQLIRYEITFNII